MTTEFRPLRMKAKAMAADRLKHHPWFVGVCTDSLPSTDAGVAKAGLEEVVQRLVEDTILWDAPRE